MDRVLFKHGPITGTAPELAPPLQIFTAFLVQDRCSENKVFNLQPSSSNAETLSRVPPEPHNSNGFGKQYVYSHQLYRSDSRYDSSSYSDCLFYKV
ncbi:hypothetical protein AVEN_147181-1 [Araneus ventricosus]|uniref:Uncharacterized protein n=1 Tax=Araneus ventricosus TaxID=182803 RepID=A0A4Y2NSD7_ARAVE|nr:hypothetical protein AVEN_147181-1 [Araneus ventricosus]